MTVGPVDFLSDPAAAASFNVTAATPADGGPAALASTDDGMDGGGANGTFSPTDSSSYTAVVGDTSSPAPDGAVPPHDSTAFQMAYGADMAWTVLFSFMIISAILGNLVVFWIVLGHRRMQNVTNYFLVNLSLADLMMSCLNTIFNFIFMKNRNWIFGSVYCTINNFIAYLSVAVSVFTLMAISIDRYIAIVRPLKPRMSKTCARVFLMVIWSSSVLLSLPSLLYSETWTFEYNQGNLTVCFLLWPDGPPTVSKQDYIYNIIYFVLTYIVPIVAMGVCYGRIGSVLWGKSIIRENACNDIAQERKLMSKRKVVKMFIVVVIIFAVCWLPYHVYFIYTYHHKEIIRKPFIQHVYLGFYWLAMANSMFNPLIYYWMNARFRSYFLSLLSSLRLILCEPARLFHRSDSKSSLDIGIVPVNRRGNVVRRMDMAQFTINVPAAKKHGVGRYPSPRDVQAGEGTSSLVNHAVIIGVVDVGNGHGGGGGKAMYKKGPNAPPAAAAAGGAGSGHNHRKRQPHHHHHHSCSHDEVSAPAPSVESFGAVSNKPSGGGLKISCCHLPKGGLRETSSNSVPDVMTLKTVCGGGGVSGGGDGGGGGGGMTKSQDTLLRVAVPFRNNPVLKPVSK